MLASDKQNQDLFSDDRALIISKLKIVKLVLWKITT